MMFSRRFLFLFNAGSKTLDRNVLKERSGVTAAAAIERLLSPVSPRQFSTTDASYVSFLYEAAFINNELVQAVDGSTFPVVNPVNDNVIGLVPDMGVQDTEKVGEIRRVVISE